MGKNLFRKEQLVFIMELHILLIMFLKYMCFLGIAGQAVVWFLIFILNTDDKDFLLCADPLILKVFVFSFLE